MDNCTSKNPTINELCKSGAISQVEFDILFEDKKSWYTITDGEEDWSSSQDKITDFMHAFSKVFSLMNNKRIDLRYIHFPLFDFKNYNLHNNPYFHNAIFSKCIFEGDRKSVV